MFEILNFLEMLRQMVHVYVLPMLEREKL